MRLYDLGSELQEAIENLSNMVDAGDITQDEMKDSLAAMEGDFDKKIDSCLYHLKNLQARSDQLKKALTDINGKQDSNTKQIEQFKSYIRLCMALAKKDKAGTQLFTASISKARRSVVIDDPKKVPDEFKTRVIEDKIDKKFLGEQLKAREIEGAHLEDGEPVLRIK